MSRNSLVGQLRYIGFLATGLLLPVTAGAATTMVARHSGKCVDVPSASTSAGVGLQQWVCNGTVAQNFSFNPTGDGFYRIVSGTSSSLCLDAGAGTGSQVTQAACSTTSNAQKWSVSQGADGAYQVKTQSGAACLNISGANANDGSALITWACGADANMKFDLPGFTPALPYSGKVTTLVASHSNKCVDVPAASTSPGVGLNQWDCVANSPEQAFQFVGTGDGFYQIKPQNSGLCLDSGSAANGTIVRQQACGSATSQKWKVQAKGNGAYALTTANGTSCLDIARISSDNGAEVTVWQCVDGANQTFFASGLGGVTPPPPPPPPNGDPNNPPATVTANGNFQLYAGRIYDPNGNMFTPRGVNIWPDQAYSFDNIVNCWKSNTVRVNHVYFDYSGWYNPWSLENTLNTFANQKVVAMVEWHEIGHIGDEPSGWNHVGVWPYASSQAHTEAIKNFFVDLAQKYKNNPYVWFNLINEPGGPPYEDGHVGDPAYSTVPRWVNVNRQIIQAIRATGAQNMIVIDGMTWGQDSRDGSWDRVDESDSAILKGGPQSMTDANGQPFGNVLFSVHTYSAWRNNPGPRLEQFFRDVRAKGMTPLVGEYNDSAMDVTQAMLSVAHNLGVGRLVWHHNSGDTQLTTTGGRTGNDINSCSNPTNLTPLGQLTWNDFHR
jgi:mannan endo-1,4-beta-mannosidase